MGTGAQTGSRKQEEADVRALQKPRSSCSRRQASFLPGPRAPPHSLPRIRWQHLLGDVPHPSPAGVKMQAPPSPAAAWNGPPAACGLGARVPCGSCVPDSSEPPWPWEAPTHESLLTTPGHGCLVSAGREGLPKQGCSGLGSRAAKRKLQGWVTTAQPNLCPQPHPLTAHSAKGSAIPGGAHQSATGRKEGNGIPQCSAALGPRP